MSLQRYRSRTADLHGDFLAEALKGARRYLRIAGYFRSSVFEVAGEALEAVPEVKILCNYDLDAADLMAAGGEAELKARWNEEDPGMPPCCAGSSTAGWRGCWSRGTWKYGWFREKKCSCTARRAASPTLRNPGGPAALLWVPSMKA